MDVGPAFVGGLAALATACCVWVWFRKANTRPSWVGFLATATASLFLMTLPAVVALYLPLANVINALLAK